MKKGGSGGGKGRGRAQQRPEMTPRKRKKGLYSDNDMPKKATAKTRRTNERTKERKLEAVGGAKRSANEREREEKYQCQNDQT
jgi:hypothetical protein